MDKETKEIVSKQTDIADLIFIEKTFFECNGYIGATILKLMNIEFKERPKPPVTEFDEYRKILDDKDTVYQEVLNSTRKST